MVFSSVLYFSFPVGALMFLLRKPIVSIVFQTGAFKGTAVEITAACLGLYFLSTAAQCLAPIILRGFFSLKDSLTPALISFFFMLVNVFLCFFSSTFLLFQKVFLLRFLKAFLDLPI